LNIEINREARPCLIHNQPQLKRKPRTEAWFVPAFVDGTESKMQISLHPVGENRFEMKLQTEKQS
jgi:hypothetical protein